MAVVVDRACTVAAAAVLPESLVLEGAEARRRLAGQRGRGTRLVPRPASSGLAALAAIPLLMVVKAATQLRAELPVKKAVAAAVTAGAVAAVSSEMEAMRAITAPTATAAAAWVRPRGPL